MFKKSLPIGTMFMVLVIALALLGVGYALWSETLTIPGSVQTGEVDVALTDPFRSRVCRHQWCTDMPRTAGKSRRSQLHIWKHPAPPIRMTMVLANSRSLSRVCTPATTAKSASRCRALATYRCMSGCLSLWAQSPPGLPRISKIATPLAPNCTRMVKQVHARWTSTSPMPRLLLKTLGLTPSAGPSWPPSLTRIRPPDIIIVPSSTMNFGSTGWGGWSCPVDHPYVVGGTNELSTPLSKFVGVGIRGFSR